MTELIRTTAKDFAALRGVSIPKARRLLRERGAKETLVKRKGGVGYNRTKYYSVIIFEYENNGENAC